MSLDAALAISSAGIGNIARELAIVSRNVSNASTPDYSREIAQDTSITAGGIGMGVGALPTTRDVDSGLQQQVFQQGGVVAGLQTSQSALKAIDAVQGSPGAGDDLSSLLGKLQDAFSTLENDPSNQAQQSQVVSAAGSLAGQVNTLSNAYASARQSAQDSIVAGVKSANTDIATIGQLSTQIVAAREDGQSTADLENQRDAAMDHLSTTTGVRFLEQPNGDMLAITPTGMQLPLHTAAPLSTAGATTAAAASYPGGGIPAIVMGGVDVTSQLTGGSLGASIALRDSTLPKFQAQLDQFAQTLASRFDRQGLTLFTDPQGSVPSASGTPVQQTYVGFAGVIQVNPAVSASPALVRDGTATIAGDPAGASAFAPNPADGPAGFSTLIARVLDFALGTQAQTGVDQPSVPTTGLGPAGNLSAGFSAPADLSGFATTLVSAQSQASADVSANLTTETDLQGNLQSRLSAGSAVSVDTEMSTMVQLQNAYAANARVLTTVQAMWTQLMQVVT